MHIAVGADHAGYAYKNYIVGWLMETGHTVSDLGTFSQESCDYPIFAERVGHAVAEGVCERGMLFCGSGIGVSIAANKIEGIRAALCHDAWSARHGVERDHINILCIGSHAVGIEVCKDIVTAFVDAEYKSAGRIGRRLAQISRLERGITNIN